ncbi:glucan 1,4-alpha-glucosidase [Paenibacillus montaniterrae]|uniref:Glucan 1,4-alpha-glucosidase n=1 Tax=Paenibacillus montaniterrae TaxID=429341 RepID=A0A919YP88_9BACL|nr:glycoside hydrolase family 3 C-terminal domain-containing protein [Paenibacillus montaniterrae]GIP16812.1 glucan 1,4-alpha-glucosidase [Paenibacillus montaniterrae]
MKQYPFQDHTLPLNERVNDLISRFTLEEKIESMVQYQPAIERLGVSAYKHGTEAAHGMAWLGEATSFPQPIGLGCTWNPQLMKQIGSAIGDEARVFYQRNPEVNGLTLWAPTVDMERDPRWGRTEEAYGEDPVLTGELTAGLVQGMQGDHPTYFKSIATLKHFIGNNNEVNRGSCSASIDPRNMKEYYQAAFKPAFVKGGAKSMMTSYNAVNGTPTILLDDVKKVVKEEWEMDGFIVSDAGDLLGIVNDHHYYDNYKQAVAHAIKAGIDSITDDKEKSCTAIREALEEGLLSEADLDQALFNTFRVRFMLGEFDPDELNPYANMPESKLMSSEHAQLSLQAAKESIVLLKNERQQLPLKADVLKSVAVVGPLADVVYRDWYAGTLPYKVTILDAVKRKLANANVAYSSGNHYVTLAPAKQGAVFAAANDEEAKLQLVEDEQQATVFELVDWDCGSYTLTNLSTGKLLTTADDKYLAATAEEAYGWFVKEVIRLKQQKDSLYAIHSWNNKAIKLPAELGGYVTVEEQGEATEQDLLRVEQVKDGIAEAKALAAAAEQAIVVVGSNPLINGKEEIDRPSLMLAEEQRKLIEEVLEVNANTVVVIVGGYPFVLGELAERIPAIVYISHAGQELGNAVADVLFGEYSPAGRLNMTWYQSEEQLTDLMDYDIMSSKRTYMFLEEKPLYPFGHGLSYASFAYSQFHIADAFNDKEELIASVEVTNNSSFQADEVVQLYVSVEGSRVKRPQKKLVAFQRVTLEAGQTKTVALPIAKDYLQIWDVTRDRFVLEQASYTFAVGSTSELIHLTKTVSLAGETIPPRSLAVWTRAENYDAYNSVYLDESKEGTTCIAASKQQGSITFKDIDQSQVYSGIQARVAGGEAGGKLIVQAAGRLLAELEISPSSEQQWSDAAARFEGAAINELTMIISGTVKLSGFQLQP